MNFSRWLFMLVSLAVFTGCATAHFPENLPLENATPEHPYYLDRQRGYDRSDELLVLLAFSGGGMRASVFSFGVMKQLANTPYPEGTPGRNLLDEVDLISAVSGGSFTAAYFGLYGYRLFEDYETEFLRRDVEGALIGRLFNPLQWLLLSAPYYDRSEMAADYYDQILFHGATFADMAAKPGPAILINATDLTVGTGFGFHQDQFDWMCSDLSRFPVSRAVTASSAVPGLFTAVTVINYAGHCPDQSPEWYRAGGWDKDPFAFRLGRKIAAYLDRESRPYIHLMDGGLADNLGLRALMDGVALRGGMDRAMRDFNLGQTQKILVIVANAAAAPSIEINRKKNPPSAFFAVDAATTVQINLYNEETVQRFQESIKRWKREINQARCGKGDCDEEVELYFVNLSLAGLDVEEERNFLQRLPTTFRLEDDAIDRLISAGERLLQDSPEFKRFLEDLR